MEQKTKQLSRLEALLFQYGEPIKLSKIANVLEIKENEAIGLIDLYQKNLKNEDRGLTILEKDNLFQLVTKPELEKITVKLAKEELGQELTPATLEVLSIVAYLGPISKIDVDFIRGVNCSFTLRNLTMRGLVEREKVGNTYHYRASTEFLKHMGLEKIEDLPDHEKYIDLLEKYKIEE
ncbi:MAG: SMC-Scp complex subunit ScpB [Candidatus Paceibacterota bacterium]